MFEALIHYRFMQYALLAGLMSAIVSGIIGVIVIEKKMVMISGGIAHTAYGGVGLAYFLGFEPLIGAFLFSILASLGIGFAKKKEGTYTDILIGLFWPLGMALGVLFISLMPSYPPDITSYLFGSILSVTTLDLILMMVLSILILVVFISLYETWKAYLFDQEFAKISGINTTFLEFFLLILIAMSVVVLLRTTGIIMAIALLVAPAATASLFTNNLKKRMGLAILLGVIFVVIGLTFSYYLDISSGCFIVIIAVLSYFIGLIIQKIELNRKEKKIHE